MKINITESITSNVSLKDVEAMIKEAAAREGYDVIKVTPQYDYKNSRSSSYDPRDIYTSTSGSTRDLTGFKVDLKRRKDNEPRF